MSPAISDSSTISTPQASAVLGASPAMSKPPVSRSDVLSNVRTSGQALADRCDKIISDAFVKHFPENLVEEIGISIVAVGSYARRSQIAGVSDADIQIQCNKIEPENFSDQQRDLYVASQAAFLKEVNSAFKVIRIEEYEGVQTRTLLDTVHDIDRVKSCIEDISVVTAYLSARKNSQGGIPNLNFISLEQDKKLDEVLERLVGGRSVPKVGERDLETIESFQQYLIAKELRVSVSMAAENISMCLFARTVCGEEVPLKDNLVTLFRDPKYREVVNYILFDNLARCLDPSYETLASTRLDLKDNIHKANLICLTLLELNKEDEKFVADLAKLGFDKDKVVATLSDNQFAIAAFRAAKKTASSSTALAFEVEFSSFFGDIKEASTRPASNWRDGIVEQLDFLTQNLLYLSGRRFEGFRPIAKSNNFAECFAKKGAVALSLRNFVNSSEALGPCISALKALTDSHTYHIFTLLEHSLRAVVVLDRLRLGLFAGGVNQGFQDLFSNLSSSNQKVLYVATFLHDMGKRLEIERGESDPYFHADVGLSLLHEYKNSEEILSLNLTDEELLLVGSLIKHHLLFKDVSKLPLHLVPAALKTIIPVELQSPERLALISLLTFADGQSTNPESWDEFRSARLLGSYKIALSGITKVGPHPEKSDIASYLSGFRELDWLNIACDSLETSGAAKVLEGLGNGFRLQPRNIVVEFLKLARVDASNKVKIVVQDNNQAEQGFSADIFIVAEDREYLASNIVNTISGHFARAGRLSVDSAEFFTGKDGRVYNRIRISRKDPCTQRHIEEMEKKIKEVVEADSLSIPTIKNRTFSTALIITDETPKSYLETQAEQDRMWIKIKTKDEPQLLEKLLIAINNAGLMLHACSVNSEGRDVEDYFEISYRNGQALGVEAKKQLIIKLRDFFSSEA